MTEFVIVDPPSERVSEPINDRAEAEDRKQNLKQVLQSPQIKQFDALPEELQKKSAEKAEEEKADTPPAREPQLDKRGNPVKDDMGEDIEANVIDHTEENMSDSAVESQPPSIDEDPVDWMPSHLVDNIQGTSVVNRKGYCVIAAKYGVSVHARPITTPGETEFEYAEFRATAVTEDDEKYSGYGSAHVDHGDEPEHIGELAETRALKRACAWATGLGLTAVEELAQEME